MQFVYLYVCTLLHFTSVEVDALSWYDYWATSSDECNDEFAALLPRTKFCPAVRDALLILLTLPATTCTVERSFSILRTVKTWLRSTTSDQRLSGLCMLSVHRDKINANKKNVWKKLLKNMEVTPITIQINIV